MHLPDQKGSYPTKQDCKRIYQRSKSLEGRQIMVTGRRWQIGNYNINSKEEIRRIPPVDKPACHTKRGHNELLDLRYHFRI
jgi:hypothetical protein